MRTLLRALRWMWLLGAVFNLVAAPLSLRAGAVFGSRRGAAPLNLRLTFCLFVIVRLPVFACLLIQHLTLAFSGAANGIPRLVRTARRGLRCNALLGCVLPFVKA